MENDRVPDAVNVERIESAKPLSGSAGGWPAAFGSLPNAPAFNSVIYQSMLAASCRNYRLAAGVPKRGDPLDTQGSTSR